MAKKVKELKFVCPECGCEKLECVEVRVIAVSTITSISVDGDFEYGKPDLSDGSVSHYECFGCGCTLKDKEDYDITSNDEVIKWIKNKMR